MNYRPIPALGPLVIESDSFVKIYSGYFSQYWLFVKEDKEDVQWENLRTYTHINEQALLWVHVSVTLCQSADVFNTKKHQHRLSLQQLKIYL